ncbi:hypothetical protein JCM13210_00960 [Thermaerobacter litoralis]
MTRGLASYGGTSANAALSKDRFLTPTNIRKIPATPPCLAGAPVLESRPNLNDGRGAVEGASTLLTLPPESRRMVRAGGAGRGIHPGGGPEGPAGIGRGPAGRR